eukprot:comp18401_c0_seq1/m.19599 comp18401_c0_seq1/g.19599  ORF comp18401_c0_seq1/g.19599 comp18401_c0_seq1/m.19599 type:complete len:180 (-) comp18401_c0_seq1:186-725(-)
MKYSLEKKACNKMLLHATKYPSQSVNGVLLGSVSKDTTVVSDAIPLFHNTLTLPAMLELALAVVSTHAKDRKLSIVGYYEAPDDLNADFTRTMTVVGEKLDGLNKGACVVCIDGKNFAPPFSEALRVYSKGGSEWLHQKQVDAETGGVRGLIEDKAHRGLVDFESHLEDSTLDWANTQL